MEVVLSRCGLFSQILIQLPSSMMRVASRQRTMPFLVTVIWLTVVDLVSDMIFPLNKIRYGKHMRGCSSSSSNGINSASLLPNLRPR